MNRYGKQHEPTYIEEFDHEIDEIQADAQPEIDFSQHITSDMFNKPQRSILGKKTYTPPFLLIFFLRY